MNILVTGGAGFIGSNFIRYWLKKYPDDRIVNLDILNYAGNLENLKEVENNPNYKFVKGDICDTDTVAEIVDKVDTIVHFAAESHVDRSIMDSGNFVRVNIEGTRVLLEAAREAGGKRFHHISTDEVFGHLGPGDPAFSERTPLAPRSPYSASKAGAEHLVRAYFYTHKLPITISNCSNNYGPYPFPEKVIPLFVTNLLEDKKVPVYGKGENVRDWIHVDDHNRGVDAIIRKGRIGETYCLGGGNEMSNLALTRMILRLMDKDESMIEYVGDRLGHDLRYAVDFSKARRELGWEPRIDFNKGLADTIKWYRDNKEWWQRIRSGAYQEYYNKQYGK
ncbi:MAG: dTDP-glucose 4,6-dehydratase [Candidatus Falkowbacteria bacterium]